MRTPHQRARRGTSLGVTLTMLAVAVAMPALERTSPGPGPTLESEHNPASCPPGHDHTICTQVEADIPLGGTPPLHEARGDVAVMRAVGLSTVPAGRSLPRGHPSRAPPEV